MADNSRIEIPVGISVEQSLTNIKADLSKLEEAIKIAGLSIKMPVSIDTSDIVKQIQASLSNITANGKKIDVRASLNSPEIAKQANAISDTLNNTSQKINQTTQAVGSLRNQILNWTAANASSFDGVITNVDEVRSKFEGLGSLAQKVSISDVTTGANAQLRAFTVNITDAEGAVRKLVYTYQDGIYKISHTQGSDSGVQKQIESNMKIFDEYTTKLNNLKANMGADFAKGMSDSLSAFEAELDKLKSGEANVADLRSHFVQLENTVKMLGSTLRGGDTSLNQFTNAVNKAKEFDNQIQAIITDYNNLNSASKTDALISSLADMQQKFSELQKIQGEEGYTQRWAEQYHAVSTAIRQVTSDIKLAKKAESEDTTSAAKRQTEELKKISAAYRDISKYTKTSLSPTATAEEKAVADELVEKNRQLVSASIERMQNEGLLNDYAKQQIQEYDNIALEAERVTKAKLDGVSAEREQAALEKDINKIINDSVKALEKWNSSRTVSGNSTNTSVTAQVSNNEKLISDLQQLQQLAQQNPALDNLLNVRAALDALIPSINTAVSSSEALSASLRSDEAIQKRTASINNLSARMQIFANSNAKAINSLRVMSNGNTFATEWQRIQTALRSNPSENQIKQLATDFRVFQNEAKAAGTTTSAFFNSMGNQLKMLVTRWVSLYAIISKVRTMVDSITDLDTAMINLKRVTNETDEAYQNFLDRAKQTAKDVYSTVTDVVEQSAKWTKAGYGIDEVEGLAKNSLVYSLVADVDNDTAVNDLVTALRGFNLVADESLNIVDKLDKLNNEYATDAKSLGSALSKSASTMHAAGNDINQTLALITGGTEITQDADSMATALNTISMRIRGMKGALEELGEESEDVMPISKIQTQILNLTKGKVNIFDANEAFRSTYDILKDISEVYDDLSSTDRASLTEILFGKLRANQGIAVINAFQSGQIPAAYYDAVNAAGTATNELNVMGEGITQHMAQLQNAAQILYSTLIDSGFLTDLIDSGTKILELLNDIIKTVGSLPSILGTIGAVWGAKTGVGLAPFVSLQNVIKNWNNGAGLVANLRNADTVALEHYNTLLRDGVSEQEAMATAMSGASQRAKVLAQSMNGTALNAADLKAKTNEVTLGFRAMNAAKNLAFSLGSAVIMTALMAGIGKLISKIKEGVEAYKEANLLTEESRENAVQAAETAQAEQKALSDLTTEYIKAVISVSDMNEAKSTLSALQDTINEKYKDEADAIDLVNGKISDNIDLLIEQRKTQAEEYLRQNQAEYEAAQANMIGNTKVNLSGFMAFSKDVKDLFDSLDLTSYYRDGAYSTFFDYDSFYLSGNLEDRLSDIKKIVAAYEELEGHDKTVLQGLIDIEKELQEQYDSYSKIISQYEEQQKILENIDGISEETRKNFEATSDALVEAQQKYNELIESGDATTKDVLNQKSLVHSLQEQLLEAAGNNEELKAIADDTIAIVDEAIASAATSTKSAVELYESELQEILDGAYSATLTNINKIKKAMQTLSEGDNLSWDDTKELLWDVDTEGVLKDIKEVNGEWALSIQELISLKDELISKQTEELRIEREQQKENIATAESALTAAESELFRQSLSNSATTSQNKKYSEQVEKVKQLKDDISTYKSNVDKTTLAIRSLNTQLGNTVSKSDVLAAVEKNVSSLQKAIDKDTKRQTKEIDNTAKAITKEKEALEAAKEQLEAQLEILEQQQQALEDTIEDYKTVESVVSKELDAEKDAIEKLKSEREEYYNAQIDAINEAQEAQEEANALEEKRAAIKEREVELEEKLRDLQKAENNKVRTFGNATGFSYAADSEAVAEAKKAVEDARKNLSDAQADYNETVSERERNDLIASIEALRDAELSDFDAQIDALEEYANAWSEAVESVTNDENELLASQILGSDWREKIKEKDTQILSNYRTDFRTYNSQLSTLVNVEIANLKKSISAKDDEISAKQQQIDYWNNLKDTIEADAQAIKDSLDDYVDSLKDSANGEGAALYTHEVNMWNFKEHWKAYAQEVIDKAAEMYAAIDPNNADSYASQLESFINRLRNSSGITGRISAITDTIRNLRGYANGGVTTTTGIAMLHGTKQSPETIFNAADSAKLYSLVHDSPNLIAQSLNEGMRLAQAGLKSDTQTTQNRTVTFSGDIYLPNVSNYSDFVAQMNQYARNALTESKIYKPR